MKDAQWKALQSVLYVGVLTFLVEMLLFVVFLFIYHCRQLKKKKNIVQGSEPSKKTQKERKSLLTVIQSPVDVAKKPGIEKEALCDTQPLSSGDDSPKDPWPNESTYDHCTTARGVLDQENEDPLFTTVDDMQDTQLPQEEPFAPYQRRPIYELSDTATARYRSASNTGVPSGYPQKMRTNSLVAFPQDTGMLMKLEETAQAPSHNGYNQKPYSPYSNESYMKSESFDTPILPERPPQPAPIFRAPSKECNVATKKATK